ncbi:hypothetical protein ACLOJK_009427 [Asimina triloba]
MHARTDAGETSVLGVSAARHGRDPRWIIDAGHQERRSGCMRRCSGARLGEHTGCSACGPETYCSCGAGRRAQNHCVASRWTQYKDTWKHLFEKGKGWDMWRPESEPRVRTFFEIKDYDASYVQKYVDGYFTTGCNRFRSFCHSRFENLMKKGLDPKQHPYQHVQKDDWEYLCELFSSEDYKQEGANVWTLRVKDLTEETQESEPLTQGQAYEKFMGKRSGYIKGLGLGPRPIKFNNASTSQNKRVEVLQKIVDDQAAIIEVQQEKIASHEKKIALLDVSVVQMRS